MIIIDGDVLEQGSSRVSPTHASRLWGLCCHQSVLAGTHVYLPLRTGDSLYLGDADDAVRELCGLLGWQEELQALEREMWPSAAGSMQAAGASPAAAHGSGNGAQGSSTPLQSRRATRYSLRLVGL